MYSLRYKPKNLRVSKYKFLPNAGYFHVTWIYKQPKEMQKLLFPVPIHIYCLCFHSTYMDRIHLKVVAPGLTA